MRVLLVGSGAREHALGWKINQSPLLGELYSLPGNPGLAEIGSLIEGISPIDVGAVAQVAASLAVDLAVIGPEVPLAAGVADALSSRGIATFGPSKAAAKLEGSKQYAKEIMDASGVATAAWAAFTESAPAYEHLARSQGPFVVKADGLAAGKGVLVTKDRTEAEAWVDRCLAGDFGTAGSTVVIEDFLDGPEVSVFAVASGRRALPLAPARDYKRLLDDHLGPNTGGMGCFSPVDDLPPWIVEDTMENVIGPVLNELADRGTPYLGFIYAGLVLTAEGPRVLEFNCRMGDPETQVVLPRLEDDLLELMLAAVGNDLAGRSLNWSERAAVDVVLAAHGYPESPRSGDVISGVAEASAIADVLVFHAGTNLENGRLTTAGGRVLNVVGMGSSLELARQSAYEAVSCIRWSGRQNRRDIARPTIID